ncbi:MAG: acylneuraminate cytidylyltransferase family protein [Acetobacter sp.]|nr:acylneuraminate cytidylyltransferase family protein [Acetobacter sp.]
MSIKALIPVRSGSQRVANKNIKPFAGSSLLEIKVKQLLRLPELDGVVVNSNSDEMLEIAHSLGAETVKRDEYFATSSVSMNEVYQNMAENMDCDTILFADATNPLILDETISNVIRQWQNIDSQYDSIATVHSIKEFLWLNGRALNYDPDNKPRSQDLPNIQALNYAVHILPRELMIQKRDIIGHQPKFVEIAEIEATDIDTPSDFAFAEFAFLNNFNKIKWGG